MYADQFKTKPAVCVLGVTQVLCTHPVHGIDGPFFFDVEQWNDSFMAAMGPFWVNGYTILITPVDATDI